MTQWYTWFSVCGNWDFNYFHKLLCSTIKRLGFVSGSRIMADRKLLSTNQLLQSVLSWRQPGTDEQPGGEKRAECYPVVFRFVRSSPLRNLQSCLSMLGGECVCRGFLSLEVWRAGGGFVVGGHWMKPVSKASAKLKACLAVFAGGSDYWLMLLSHTHKTKTKTLHIHPKTTPTW